MMAKTRVWHEEPVNEPEVEDARCRQGQGPVLERPKVNPKDSRVPHTS